MSDVNPLWGAPRIHGELRKLRVTVNQSTVAKYMGRREPSPLQNWRTFLASHVGQVVAADFFVVPTVTYRLLFVLVLLSARPHVARDERRDHPGCITATTGRPRSPGSESSSPQRRGEAIRAFWLLLSSSGISYCSQMDSNSCAVSRQRFHKSLRRSNLRVRLRHGRRLPEPPSVGRDALTTRV